MSAPNARRLSILPVLTLSLFAACETVPQTEGPGSGYVVGGSRERLAQLQPGDVAIAPIKNQTGDEGVPLEALRQGFVDALAARLYSPLDVGYVDANWTEASFAGTPQPDALLVIALSRWDPSHLYSNGDVSAEAEIILFEGGDTTGNPLWGTTSKAKVNLGDGHGNPPQPDAANLLRAGRELALELLGTLPERDPMAVQR